MSNLIVFPNSNTPTSAGMQSIHTPEPMPSASGATFEDYQGKANDFFTVDNLPLTSPRGTVANKRGIFVGNNCINVVSPSYEVHQPLDVYKTFLNVAESTGLEVKRVLNNPVNGGLLISAEYSQCKIIGEDHAVNLTFYTSHCGKYKTFLTLDLLRIACFNQTPVLYKNKDRHIFAEKHYRNALDISLIESTLEGIPASIEAYNTQCELLEDTVMSWEDFVEYYIEANKVNREAKQFQTKIDKLKAIYCNAPGQRELGANQYKAYNAVTYMNTHEGRETALKQERVYLQGSADSIKHLRGLQSIAA